MTAEQALRTLLQRRGLEFEQVSERTVRVRRAATARPAESKARAEPAEEEPVTLPELLVRGSRSLNANIRRSIDDLQPYVVFDRTAIERAGAINFNDLLLKRLSSNTYATTTSQSGNTLVDKRRSEEQPSEL